MESRTPSIVINSCLILTTQFMEMRTWMYIKHLFIGILHCGSQIYICIPSLMFPFEYSPARLKYKAFIPIIIFVRFCHSHVNQTTETLKPLLSPTLNKTTNHEISAKYSPLEYKRRARPTSFWSGHICGQLG